MDPSTAFLQLIGWSEGTILIPESKFHGYDVIVTGEDGKHETFTDFSQHPFLTRAPKLIGVFNGKEIYSSASGRYQIILPTWRVLSHSLSLSNFSSTSQDKAALELLRECGSLAKLDAGDIPGAITSANKIWASLPGNSYGQGGHTVERLMSEDAVILKG